MTRVGSEIALIGSSVSLFLLAKSGSVNNRPEAGTIYPESGGIAVSVRTKKNDGIRVLHLPATVLQSVRGRRAA